MKLCVIIGVKGRLKYLEATINSFLKSFESKDICIVENSQSPEAIQICKKYKLNYLFIPLECQMFNRSLCFNSGFLFMDKKNKYDYFLFHDVDLVVRSSFLNDLMLNIKHFNYPNCIQTYGKKRVLLTTQKLGEKILNNNVDIDSLTENTEGVYIHPNFLKTGAHSKGGSILIKRSKYLDVGGHDHDLFNGYAPEDTAFWEKITLNDTVYSANHPVINIFHIWHTSSQNTNPNFKKMESIYLDMKSSSNKKIEYINSSKKSLEILSHKIFSPKEFYDEKLFFNENKKIVSFNDLGKFGRLGNQLFQIAATLSYAADNDFIVRLSWNNSYSNINYSDFFKNKIFQKNNLNIKKTYTEPNLSYNKIPNLGSDLNLKGYFQSEKYFKNNEKIIRFYLTPTDQLLNEIKSKYSNIINSNTCSIHIRRTDYIGNASHDVCDLKYYIESIKKIKNITNIDNFLIFSDDIDWCKKNFSSENIFINNNTDIFDLFLMSLCKHNIISNSSFSWWGSWLNKNPNKIIIAPNKWFPDKSLLINEDIYTENMIKVKVD